MDDALVFYVNGRLVSQRNPEPEQTLLSFLRINLSLTGTKLGCGEGGCGACTVMISKYDHKEKRISHYSANACLTPVCSVHGYAVTTVEGIGSIKNGLHPVQERIARAHGTQCGFCTPGFVMSMYTLLRNNPYPSAEELEKNLEGNLCRCTGYRPIIEGFMSFTKDYCSMGENCCKNKSKGNKINKGHHAAETIDGSMLNGHHVTETKADERNGHHAVANGITNGFLNGVSDGDPNDVENGILGGSHGDVIKRFHHTESRDKRDLSVRCKKSDIYNGTETGLFNIDDCIPYDPTQEPIFPPSLQLSDKFSNSMMFVGERCIWYRVVSLDDLVSLKHKHPKAKIIIGNTEIGVDMNIRKQHFPVLIHACGIPELSEIEFREDSMQIGSSVTLSKLEAAISKAKKEQPEYKTRVLTAFEDILKWFAGKQVKNAACIGGNIMTASPISDLNPLLVAIGAKLTILSEGRGRREVIMDQAFFKSYRKTCVDDDDILLSITIRYTKPNEYFMGYKQANRRDDDIAIVNSGMRVVIDSNQIIEDISLCFGGMAITTRVATITMAALKGCKWNEKLIEKASDLLLIDLPLNPGAPGGATDYRQTLALSFFYKFFLHVCLAIHKGSQNNIPPCPRDEQNAAELIGREMTRGSQVYQAVPNQQDTYDPVWRPLIHASAFKHATGEAIYVDDMPQYKDEVFLTFVLSTRPHALIRNIDTSLAEQTPGFVAFVSYKDIPGKNLFGTGGDEEVFATEKVECQHQIIAAVLSDTKEHSKLAAKAVKIEYEELEHIITIKEAIAANSYIGKPKSVAVGDVEEGFKQSDHIIEGELSTGGQEHFYLETQSCLIIPEEDGDMTIYSSTQEPGFLQDEVANTLDVACSKLVVKTLRLGGGFGGKERGSTLIAVPTAVAANKVGKPVRCILDRNEDMAMTGGRHPYYFRYKAGFTKSGRILAWQVDMYSNGGNVLDRSAAVHDSALSKTMGGYGVPNVKATAFICKTNIPSNTAFRAFGQPQMLLFVETCVSEIAHFLGVYPEKIRDLNLMKDGDMDIFKMPYKNCHLRKCWEKCEKESQFYERKQEIEAYNRENRWKKRGVSMTPLIATCGYGVGCNWFMQGGALIHVYKDGSVMLTISSVEMGQGLYVKMMQVASRILRIPISRITMGIHSTDKVPNDIPTAASASSELSGLAVMDACKKLMKRLEPVIAENMKGSWEEWVKTAFLDRICLSATGYGRSPGLEYDVETGKGQGFPHYIYGAACSVVEIDCLTGDHVVLRSDIVMDLGKSLNPAIDVGQIEGGFVQGYGYMVLEDVKVTPDGLVITQGPGNYKIPSARNIPVEFNVTLLQYNENETAVYSSKAVGEPPLNLANSVFFAIKEAITAARAQSGITGIFQFDAPATPDRIRMSCVDRFTRQVPHPEEGTYRPWVVKL